MTTGRVDWRVRRPFGDLEIELHPRSLDAAEREASLRELRELVHEFKSRRPEVRRVVLEIYARVRGLAVGAAPADERVAEELLAAARAGVIGARRREIHAVAVPQDAPSSQVLGPASSETHVYKIRVYDDTGAPVAGVALKLTIDGGDEAQTTSGSGEVTVQKSDPGTATFTITNLDDIRDKLWPQWSKPLATTPPAADKVLSAPVTQPLSPQTAPSDWVVTLVLTRPPIWRVRMVGMIFDADKCFPLPQALDGVRSVVAMHQAHPTAKVVIVGHEGGDEVTGGVDIALGRAKMLAAFLTSKPDDWMPWFDADKSSRQRWGVREVQLMLSALSGPNGPFYDGSAAGIMDPKTTDAVKAFQQANGLGVDGKTSAATRKALVTQYMALEDTSLAADITPVAHGCTGHVDDTITQDGLQPDDRRLEVLFFDFDIKPPPSGDTSGASAPEYPAWKARLVETVDFENHGIHVQLVDTQKQPVPLAAVHLDGPTQADTTADEHGFVTFFGLVAGDYTIQGTTRMGIVMPPTKITYPTAKTVEDARVIRSKGGAS